MVRGHERSVYSISWRRAPEMKEGEKGWLASVSGDGKINVWDMRTVLSAEQEAMRGRIGFHATHHTRSSWPVDS